LEPTTTTNKSEAVSDAASARRVALRVLALRRLTEAQLWKKLIARGYDDETVAQTVASCRRDGYIDDRLYATLYVEGARKAVGNVRLVADLIKRGIDREAAQRAVAEAPLDQAGRIAAAYAKLTRTKPNLSYQSAARSLERLGFPTSLIYRELREHARAEFADVLDGIERDPAELRSHSHAAAGYDPRSAGYVPRSD
jgi:regulatory protein